MKKILLSLIIGLLSYSVSFAQANCDAPKNAKADRVTYNSTLISWDSVPGVKAYQLHFKKQSDSIWRTTNTYTNSKKLNWLKDSTEYNFEVRSYCGNRQFSNWSATGSFTTLKLVKPLCNMPTNVAVSKLTLNSAVITWDNDSSIQAWAIRYKKSGNSYWKTIYSKTNTQTLNYLRDSTTYEYQVRTMCSYRNFSNWTPIANFTTLTKATAPPCNTPTNVSVSSITHNSATITWDNDTSIQGWHVRFKKLNDNYWKTLGSKTNSAVLKWLKDSSIYEYQVRAICGYRNYSNWTSVANFTTLSNTTAPVCNLPTNITANNITYHSATITWDNDTSVQGWHVRFKKPIDSYWTNLGSKTNGIDLKRLKDSTTYEYQIRTNCSYGNSSNWTSIAQFTTISNGTPPSVCNTPTNIVIGNITYHSAAITWDNDTSVLEWHIRFMKLKDRYWRTTRSKTNNISLNWLRDSTTYVFQVRAKCGHRSFSSWTSASNFTTLAKSTAPVCNTPTNIAVSNISYHSATITWDNDTNIYGWNIRFKAQSRNYWRTIETRTNSKTLNWLRDSTTYVFQVRSKCGYRNYSNWSTASSFMTLDDTSITIPKTAGSLSGSSSLIHDVNLDNETSGFRYSIYPNPSNGTFTLNTLDFKYSSLLIYDYRGMLVKNLNASSNHKYKFDDLSSGLYFIQLVGEDATTEIKKLIIKK